MTRTVAEVIFPGHGIFDPSWFVFFLNIKEANSTPFNRMRHQRFKNVQFARIKVAYQLFSGFSSLTFFFIKDMFQNK